MAVTFFWLRRLSSAIAQNNRMQLRIDLQVDKLQLSLRFAVFFKNVSQNAIFKAYVKQMTF